MAAKNLLARASPPFERIVVYHYDVDTLEWDDCEPVDVIASFPTTRVNSGTVSKRTC